MWLWPTFARADKLKRGLINGTVIVLAALLLFVVAPLVGGSLVWVGVSLAVFLVVGLGLRFVPVWLRLGAVRRAATTLRASHGGADVLVANARVASGSVPELGTAPYTTVLFSVSADDIAFWSPEQLDAPLLAVPRASLRAAEVQVGSPARLLLTFENSSGEVVDVQLAVFRERGSRVQTPEFLAQLAARLVTPRLRA